MGNNWKGTVHTVHVHIDALKQNRIFISEYWTEEGFKQDSIAVIENEHDAHLFADALNTIQECGLMPSELKRQRDELVELVNGISGNKVAMDHISDKWQLNAEQLIKKIKR